MSIQTIILAAGYGTRLQKQLLQDPQLHYLSTIPKPLLPISSKPILSHWIQNLTHPLITTTTIVTNSLHRQHYTTWSPNPAIKIIQNETTTNEQRLGAVADLNLAISTLSEIDVLLIIAGDTLLPNTDINQILQHFYHHSDVHAAVLAYKLSDMSESTRRGMLQITQRENQIFATKLVEKPLPNNSPSDLATAPVYLLRRSAISTVQQFLNDTKHLPLEYRDAPGYWLAYLLQSVQCLVYQVSQRIDIGALQHYKHALWTLATGHTCARHEKEPAVGRAFPRVGFLGNPSDGYGGAVIAFSIASEGFAEVVATQSDKFRVLPNRDMELSTEWSTVDTFLNEVHSRGLGFGARKLVYSAVVVFAEILKRSGKTLPTCELSYSTTIPARLGLAGSSALILATFRALARLCAVRLEDVSDDVKVWPELMKKAETDYLGIACGLMDRVVQVLQGVIYMDFAGETWKWERLKEELPDMWLAYSRHGPTECSGNVHSGLTKRFLQGDQVIKEVTESLRAIVEEGRDMIARSVWDDLPALFTRNFELRCRLVGTERVGQHNIRLVDIANTAGFAAKMTGSGGCALCIPNPLRKLSDDDVDSARHQFEEAGFVLRRIKVLNGLQWEANEKP